MGEELHVHEMRILRFLESYWRRFLRAPSIEDIRANVQLPSKDHVYRDLAKLEEKGYISRERGMARSIRLLRTVEGRSFHPDDVPVSKIISVPLLGKIAAGEPIHWPDSDFSIYDSEMIELAQEMVGKRQEVYALKVKGNSMIDAMVYDGDIVIMQRYEGRPEDGEIVAIWLADRGETTLKKFYAQGDQARLQPCNPTMSPLFVDARDVRVQGKLLAVIRQIQ